MCIRLRKITVPRTRELQVKHDVSRFACSSSLLTRRRCGAPGASTASAMARPKLATATATVRPRPRSATIGSSKPLPSRTLMMANTQIGISSACRRSAIKAASARAKRPALRPGSVSRANRRRHPYAAAIANAASAMSVATLAATPQELPLRRAYSDEDLIRKEMPCDSVCNPRMVSDQKPVSSTPGVRWNKARLNRLRRLSLMRAAISSARRLRRRVSLSASSTSARDWLSCARSAAMVGLSGGAPAAGVGPSCDRRLSTSERRGSRTSNCARKPSRMGASFSRSSLRL